MFLFFIISNICPYFINTEIFTSYHLKLLIRDRVDHYYGYGNISKLIESIFTGYDKRLRPNYKGDPVEIEVTLFIISITSISEINMDFTVDLDLRQYWKDPRLIFQDSMEDELILTNEIIDKLWWPDTIFGNAKSSKLHTVTSKNAFARIKYNGLVTLSLRLSITAACLMNLRHFPMDVQICSLEMESFPVNYAVLTALHTDGYPVEHISYAWKDIPKESVTFRRDLHPQNFQFKGFRIMDDIEALSTGNYSHLILQLRLVRCVSYYIIQIYVPCTFMVALSWIPFWLDRNSAIARISLGITAILTLTTFVSNFNSSLPKLGYLTSLDVYVIACFVFVFSAILEFSLISLIENRPCLPTNQLEMLPQFDTIEGKRLARSGGLNSTKFNISEAKSNENKSTSAVTHLEPVWKSFESSYPNTRDTISKRKASWNIRGNSTVPKPTDCFHNQPNSRKTQRIENQTTNFTFNSDHLSLNEFYSSSDLTNTKDFPSFRPNLISGNETFPPNPIKHKDLRNNSVLQTLKNRNQSSKFHRILNKTSNENTQKANPLDRFSRVAFPTIFLSFIALYWLINVGMNKEAETGILFN